MGTVGWLLVVAVGVALGFAVGRLWPGQAARIAELEREREAARDDLRAYRQDVGAHFERTAQLFDKVTHDYRSLYEHLATGARQLGAIPGESRAAPLAEPERRQLGPVAPVSAEIEAEAARDVQPEASPQADGAAETATNVAAGIEARTEAAEISAPADFAQGGEDHEEDVEAEESAPPREAAERTERKAPDALH